MTDILDGYAEWLGMSTAMRPPSHYQLLGLKDFESDRAKIVAAAEASQSKMHGVAPGNRLDEWQRILDELSVAKLVLCDAARRGQYDGQLRSRLASRPAAAAGRPSAGEGTAGSSPAGAGQPSNAARSLPAGGAVAPGAPGASYAMPPMKRGAGQSAVGSSPQQPAAPAADDGAGPNKQRSSLASLGYPAEQRGDALPQTRAGQPPGAVPQQPAFGAQPQPFAPQPHNPAPPYSQPQIPGSGFPQPQAFAPQQQPFAAQPQQFMPHPQAFTPQSQPFQSPLPVQPSFAPAGPQPLAGAEAQSHPTERPMPLPETPAPESLRPISAGGPLTGSAPASGTAMPSSSAPLSAPAPLSAAAGSNAGPVGGVLRPMPLPGAGAPGADGVVVRNTPRPLAIAGRSGTSPMAVPEPARKGPAGGKQSSLDQKKIIMAAGVGALVLAVMIVFGAPRSPSDSEQVSQAPPKPKHLNPLGDPESDSHDKGGRQPDDEHGKGRGNDASSESEPPATVKPKKSKAPPKHQPPAAEESAADSMPPARSKAEPPKKPAASGDEPEMPAAKPPSKPADNALVRNDRPAAPEMTKPAGEPGDSAPDAEQTAAFNKALLRVRGLLAARNVDAADGALKEAKAMARSAEQRTEAARLEELAGYVAGFWNAVRESMKGLQQTEEIKIGSVALTVVSSDQSEVTFHRPGRNDTYTVMNMPGGIAFALADRWYDKVNPVNKIYLGAFHAADPSGDLAEARRLWEAASKSGASANDLMPLLDLPRVQPQAGGSSGSDDKPEKGEKTALARADRAFLQKYGPEMRAAGTPQERLDLSDRLLMDARSASDAAEKTILFRRACELVGKVAISSSTPDDVAHGAAEKAIQLIDQALEEKHPENAKNLGQAVIMAARKSKDETLIKDATERSKKLQEAMKVDNS